MRRLTAISALALALIAAGCGSGSGGGGGQTSGGAPTSAGGQGSGGKVVTVHMKNIQFDPKTITVQRGTTIEWVNDDSVRHDVTKSSGPGPDFESGSGNIRYGQTYKQTFDTAGTIKYHCTVHLGMNGTIVVK